MRRKWVSSAVALVVVSGFALGGAYLARHLRPREGSLTFPEQVDLGTIERGKVLEVSFPIKNQSSHPVRLSDFLGDCSCMGLFQAAPSGPEPLESVLLNAGEEVAVGARFAAPEGRDAVFAHRVTFRAYPPAPQQTSVLITGTVDVPMFASRTLPLQTRRWPQQAWSNSLTNQDDGSVNGAVSAWYACSRAGVGLPSACSEARIPSRVSSHHRAQGLPPRTTSALAS